MKACLGAQVGEGVYRTVFECALAQELVLKIAKHEITWNFANVQEFTVWQAVQFTEMAKWFAPCVDVSHGGLVLIQRKTEKVRAEELRRLLPKVPRFFTDLKAANWGRLDGRIVCHDYGNHLMLERGMGNVMRAADWADD
ncbi:MAG TPA: hypothetical protein VHF69_00380 [Candidatus Synoicihabitans sp.]|nr:hypothetical protein [Candidatus Synoicihabitans sp.]